MTKRDATVVGVFEDRPQAERAVEALRRAGFRSNQVGIIAHDKEGEETYAEEGAVTGALAGGALGGIAGALAAGLIPGIGPVVAGGILAATLGGAAAGAAIGGLAGALIGWGIPEEEAHFYEQEFRLGRVLVVVKSPSRAAEARTILRRYKAYDASRRERSATAGSATAGSAAATAYRAGGAKVELKEERLRPRKETVQAGEVRVRKDVTTEHRTLDVPVTREEVVVERRPVHGRRASATDIGREKEIRIPVRKEQVHVEKTPVVREEVEVSKRKVQGTEQVAGTVRREKACVEQVGDVKVQERHSTSNRPTRR